MPRPPLLPHRGLLGLLLGLALGLALAVAPVPGGGPLGTPPASAATRAGEDAPLGVGIASMSPSTLPRTGTLTFTGTVTNRSAATWRDVRLYGIVGATPLTTRAELATALDGDPEDQVGERVTDEGTFTEVRRLGPGETARYRVRIPADRLPVSGAPGVYWVGVHALGTGPEGRDQNADGRARTFAPLLASSSEAVRTSLLVPLRRSVARSAAGRVSGITDWTTDLSSDGRLGRALALADAAGSTPLTYVVDPAVVDAARQLAVGNPARSLDATLPAQGEDDGDDDPSDGPSASASGSPSAGGGATGGGDTSEPAGGDGGVADVRDRRAAATASAWVERATGVLTSRPVLALPYGDLDVSAAAAHDPRRYRALRAVGDRSLGELGIRPSEVVAPPSGLLSPAGLALSDDALVVLDDDAVAGTDAVADDGGSAPRVTVDGRDALVADTLASGGGPGPGSRLSTVAVRQQVLAVAALRSLEGRTDDPLLVDLPTGWSPTDPDAFFAGLDVPWLTLTPLTAATSAPATAVDRLAYPRAERGAELPATSFEAARDLVRAGRVLDDVLVRNDQVAERVARQAAAATAYEARRAPDRTAAQAAAATRWVDTRLARVRLEPPTGVTLSSESGRITATVENGLDQPVEVQLRSSGGGPVTISTPDPVRLEAGERSAVTLEVTSQAIGTHDVLLTLTDDAGRPLGDPVTLPVRSARVSEIIWIVIGGGLVLFVGALVVQTRRRRAGA